MAQDWGHQTNAQAPTDILPLDFAETFLSQYDAEFLQPFDESWLSAALLQETEALGADATSGGVHHIDTNPGCDQTEASLEAAQSNELNLDYMDFEWDLPLRSAPFDGTSLAVKETIATNDEQIAAIPTTSGKRPRRTFPPSTKTADLRRSLKRFASGITKPKRAKISKGVRAMLDAHFSRNPYPTERELDSLSQRCGFTDRVIKTWFDNARSRKTTEQVNHIVGINKIADVYNQEGHDPTERRLSPGAIASCNGSREYDRHSPAPSASSLERYLTQPTTQDPVPTVVIESALQNDSSQYASPVEVRPETPVSLPRTQEKATRACNACRHQRAGCTGEVPICTLCKENGRLCTYEEPSQTTRRNSSTHQFRHSISRQQTPVRSMSIAGSDHSAGSFTSVRSTGSRISVDSRGSRRGRKRWIPPPSPPPAHRPSTLAWKDGPESQYPDLVRRLIAEAYARFPDNTGQSSYNEASLINIRQALFETVETAPPAAGRYFCTWPGCDSCFPNKSAWTRHEEAVHYCPYHWICGLDVKTVLRLPWCFICWDTDVLISHIKDHHCYSCATKSKEDRTFVREDQLSQHMNRNHIDGRGTQKIPKEILSAWKIDNPALSASSLRCGFCGDTFDTWRQRLDHVALHMRNGICRSAWWPERLPRCAPKLKITSPFHCSSCGREFPDADSAAQEHPNCSTFSCRHLLDWHSLYRIPVDEALENTVQMSVTSCRLCSFTLRCEVSDHMSTLDALTLEEHADTHQLRACTQDIFRNGAEFRQHMITHHRATKFQFTPWQQIHQVETSRKLYAIHTIRSQTKSILCATTMKDTTTVIDEDGDAPVEHREYDSWDD